MGEDARSSGPRGGLRGTKLAAFWVREESLSVLLLLLVMVMFVLPALHLGADTVVGDVLLGLLFLSGVATVGWSRLGLGLSAVLVVLALGLTWSGLAHAGGTARVLEVAASLGCEVLFFFFVLARALSPGPITRHRVTGAVAAFLLMGLACAFGFELIELLRPGSIAGLAGVDPLGMRRELGYLSLVTLTTVGYGDVTPVGEAARALATFEGFLGQLYPAVTIGWMVSQLPGRQR